MVVPLLVNVFLLEITMGGNFLPNAVTPRKHVKLVFPWPVVFIPLTASTLEIQQVLCMGESNVSGTSSMLTILLPEMDFSFILISKNRRNEATFS